LFVELEALGNPQAFHPEQVSRRRGGHNQLMSCEPGNFLVREKVLQFHPRAQANRLKPIARPPMAHQHARADFVCVKIFHTGGEFWRSLSGVTRGSDLPADLHSAKVSFSAATVQLQYGLARAEAGLNQPSLNNAPGTIAKDCDLLRKGNRLFNGSTQVLDQIEVGTIPNLSN